MYTLNRVDGKVAGVWREVAQGRALYFERVHIDLWSEFEKWNAAQPVPMDLSDNAPDSLPADREFEAIKVLLEKPEKDLALADLKGLLVRLLRERYGVSSKL